ELNSPNYIIYDRTEQKVLESQNEKEETAIASLTKIITVIKYAPAVEDFGYTSLSLTVSSESLLNVRLRGEDSDWRVSFTATDFSVHSPDDEADYRRMMKRISTDDLKAMYALFVTDLHQLAESCRDAA
ncbi:MAG: hypothetical protein IIY89_06940, partial [Clostridia bacterium]|nr:hypothetical protein [Clostridia bacterium]